MGNYTPGKSVILCKNIRSGYKERNLKGLEHMLKQDKGPDTHGDSICDWVTLHIIHCLWQALYFPTPCRDIAFM